MVCKCLAACYGYKLTYRRIAYSESAVAYGCKETFRRTIYTALANGRAHIYLTDVPLSTVFADTGSAAIFAHALHTPMATTPSHFTFAFTREKSSEQTKDRGERERVQQGDRADPERPHECVVPDEADHEHFDDHDQQRPEESAEPLLVHASQAGERLQLEELAHRRVSQQRPHFFFLNRAAR